MFVIIWEYEVSESERSEFERIYASTGAWAGLFSKSKEYLGTELLHDEANQHRYITIDRWVSKEAYEDFLNKRKKEYKALDDKCEELTIRETLIGKWITI